MSEECGHYECDPPCCIKICKLEVYNGWYRRCKEHTVGYLRPDHKPFIAREEYLTNERATKERAEDDEMKREGREKIRWRDGVGLKGKGERAKRATEGV